MRLDIPGEQQQMFVSLQEVLFSLQSRFEVRLLREGEDMDVWVEPCVLDDVLLYLQGLGFVVQCELLSKVHAYKRLGTSLWHIDITYSLDYLFVYFAGVDTTGMLGVSDLLVDTPESKCLRYLLLLRRERLSFFYEHATDLAGNRYYVDRLPCSPFVEDLTPPIVTGVVSHRWWVLFRALRWRFFASYITQRIRAMWRRLGSGKIVAFVGVDGSGKSTALDALGAALPVRVMYMGGRGYRLQSVYDRWGSIAGLKPLIFVCYWVEHWVRWLEAKRYTIRGVTVLADRYAKWELVTGLSVPLVNKILYQLCFRFLFPRPDHIVLLWHEPAVLYARKDEHSIADLSLMQERLMTMVGSEERCVRIQSDSKEQTLNAIMTCLGGWGVL